MGRYNQSFGEARAQRKYFLIALKLFLLAGLGVLPLALALLGLFEGVLKHACRVDRSVPG